MPVSKQVVQPSPVLHEVIVGGGLRANGTNFSAWCAENGISREFARLATYGISGGAVGRGVLDRLIDAAGRDWVLAAYTKRMVMEAERLKGVAA